MQQMNEEYIPDQNNQQRGGGWITEIFKSIMIMLVVQNVIGYFFKSPEPQQPISQISQFDQQDDSQPLNNKFQHNRNQLYNILRPQQPFDFDVYLSFKPQNKFFTSNAINQTKPIWSEKQLSYEFSQNNLRDFNLTLPVHENIRNNKTLYLHMQVTTYNPFYKFKQSDSYQGFPSQYQGPYLKFNQSIPLIKYMPKIKDKKLRNLFDSMSSNDYTEIYEAEEEQGDDLYLPHFKKELYLYLIYDQQVFSDGKVLPQLANHLKVDLQTMTYQPIMYLSDYWILKKDLILVNESVQDLNLTLHFDTYSVNYFIFQKQFEQQHQMQASYGLESGDMDEIKRMFLETDPILLGVTMVVSLLHTIFEVLAFKNDISFWNSKDSMEGISVKSLYVQFFCSTIIFLYLMDNETSFMIVASSGFGLLLDVWKIKKASKVKRIETFPYFTLEDNQNYVQSETKEYDRIAMRYMSYAMFPILIGYTIYSAFYNEHKGWYSFIINTLVGCIYTFGFIQMTPQLYINYRLKTVEHMPGKALFYRFLNTIIDDLFSFIITMPTLHRISCFRDDAIFLIYLYQRWAYKVDKTRGPFAERKKEEENKQLEELKNDEKDTVEIINKSETLTHRKVNQEESKDIQSSQQQSEQTTTDNKREKQD